MRPSLDPAYVAKRIISQSSPRNPLATASAQPAGTSSNAQTSQQDYPPLHPSLHEHDQQHAEHQAPVAHMELSRQPWISPELPRATESHDGRRLVPSTDQIKGGPSHSKVTWADGWSEQHGYPSTTEPAYPLTVSSSSYSPYLQNSIPNTPAQESAQNDSINILRQGLVTDSMYENGGDDQADDPDDDIEMGDDLGDDPLLAMQNNLATFEDSVRTFVGAGTERSLFAEHRDEPVRPRKVVRRGPRKPAEPTGDVKLRLSAASDAFMSGRLDEALDYVNDAIRINGEIHRAWSLLAEILRERGEYKQSLLAMVCAAHLQPKIFDVWLQCGRFALDLIEEFPDDAEDTLKIAIMALSQAIKIQPDNMGVRQTRAALYLTRESFRLAVSEYKFMVERSPCDVLALRGFVDASVQSAERGRRAAEGQREAARDAYRHCIKHLQTEYPTGASNPELVFTWDDAVIYVALLIHLEQYQDALNETRSLARWLVGRGEEAFWDQFSDDREWDVSSDRRKGVEGYDPDKYPSSTYGSGLPLRLRISLSICRLRLDQENDSEAMRHLEWLNPLDIAESEDESQNADLFLEVANVLYETQRLPKALQFFEPLRQIPDFLDATALYRAGKCYLQLGDKRQAEECFTAALDSEETPVETRINARYELASMYEAARKNAEAYILVNEALNLEHDRDQAFSESEGEEEIGEDGQVIPKPPKTGMRKRGAVTRKPRQNKAGTAPRKPREPRSRESKQRMYRPRPLLFALDEDRRVEEERRSAYFVEQWEIIRNGRENSNQGPGVAWMEAARTLVDDFRAFKAFYPWDRYLTYMGLKKDESSPSSSNPHLLKMAQRLRDEVDAQQSSTTTRKLLETTVSYRDVAFPEWLDLFLELALSLAHLGRTKEAYAVCESAMGANVFFENPEDKFLINITTAGMAPSLMHDSKALPTLQPADSDIRILACAVRARDEERCVEVARTFMSSNPFSSDAFRMYAALGRLCHSAAAWYADSRVQKFTLRQIKFMDSALVPAEDKTKMMDGYDPRAYPGRELDVQLLMLYGHILFVSNSFTFALNYFVRARALDPDNLMVNISIGQAYLHYALKRQAENRQHFIAQGFAFLHRYYDAKLAAAGPSSQQRQEAHYNLARSYHAVGLAHLAAEYYRRVFREVETDTSNRDETAALVTKRQARGPRGGDDDLVREAAYNLQMCCLVGGDIEGVRELGERWLVM
ncbi:hypothetical protein BX600DRAFT_526676 [Xylariales sp. PMI_506]|nr:hypothetical protein BX600DRAFT_526676 [Xylariales sp. PMI_506]